MDVLLFLFGTALSAGLYFVLADLLKIPRLATERALISAGRRERSLVKALEALILGWALKLAPLIRMDEYKYRRLESKLTAAGLDMTPQVYTAYSILKPCLILLGIIPCLLILPILSPLIVALAVLTWFKESRRADELVFSWQNPYQISGFLRCIQHFNLHIIAYQRLHLFFPENSLCFALINSGFYYVYIVESGNSLYNLTLHTNPLRTV